MVGKTQNPTTGQLPSAIWRQLIGMLGAKNYPRNEADAVSIAKEIRALWNADLRYLDMAMGAMPSILNDLRRLKVYPDQFFLARRLVHRLYTSPTRAMSAHPCFAEVKDQLQHCVNGDGCNGHASAAIVDKKTRKKSRRQTTSPTRTKDRKNAETVASN